jgi:predicted transcriptional regulator
MATTPRSIRLDDELWARLDRQARSMNLTTNLVASAVLTHWARLADENPDTAALVVTRPNASLQELADLVVKLRPTTD